MKKILTLMTVTVLALSIVSCKKKEEPQPAPQQSTAAPSGPIIEPTAPPPGHGAPGQVPPGHEPMGQKVEFQVMVPPEVTNTWSGVKLILEDRKQNKQQELAASIGGEVKIPG
ncbi:MAG: hypothetical protein HZA14_11100, partial [Nitrospirae bacterium]|nr:hypothetical protein [Nitrospirota bacterium]